MGPALGQDRAGSGKVPLVRTTRKGRAQLCRKDIGPLDLEGWGGREVETTPSCPLGWLREEQLRVGTAMGWGKGMIWFAASEVSDEGLISLQSF